ncbi:lantibiotic dehydratase C-terminal domain-containing protein [Streptomyces sp. NPDC048416]|uniref:lantibiotic dehydratase C-terminal domain-containing protein n=1 Tax=Streptomyces sp. NPDC048416 TaxID=3365546 RepID=UPI00371711C8
MLTRPPEGAPDPAPEDRWVSAHVFTGHPLDLVVRELIPPAVAELRLRGLADRFFFLRHWQGGPHLRLRVRTTTPAAAPQVRATLHTHATAMFAGLPVSRPMTERQYAALARDLAAAEPDIEPGVLAPNDSLAFQVYRPEHGKYGHGDALRAVEDAFATCSELALAAVLAPWSPAQRTAHCFALLAGSTDAPAPPGRPTPDALAQYKDKRAALLTVARAARTAVRAGAGGLADIDPGHADPLDADPVSRWLAACRNAQRHVARPARLAGHLTHLACNRLDVRPGQEATLRALAQLAVADATGDDPPPALSAPRDTRHHRDRGRNDGGPPP